MGRHKVEKIRKRDREENQKFEWKSCRSKSRFTEFEARRKAKAYDQGVYRCPICGMWHLTSQRGYNE